MISFNMNNDSDAKSDANARLDQEVNLSYSHSEYLLDKDAEERIHSNNSSRTFCERSADSPLVKDTNDSTVSNRPEMTTFDVHNTSFFQNETLDQGYQAPFGFHYEGNQDDFMRYRPENHTLYNSSNYDLSYMHQMTQLSSHMNDNQHQHCTIPIGKRRPRTIMISGDSNDLSSKLFDPADTFDTSNYNTSRDGKSSFSMPSLIPSRYYFPNKDHAYSGMATGHHMDIGVKRSDLVLMNDPRSMFNFEGGHVDEVLVIPQPVVTANLPNEHRSNSMSTTNSSSSAPRGKLKITGKRQKHVRKACIHCKKAHLACDESRPCKRCVHLGKTDCVDVEHKRRGRPRGSPEKKRMDIKMEIPTFTELAYPTDDMTYRYNPETSQGCIQ